MKKMKTRTKLARLTACGAIILGYSSCGTTSSVSQQIAGPPPNGPVYVMGSCVAKDSSASQETCNELRDFVQYGLLKKGLYATNAGDARRKVNLTITFFSDVGAAKKLGGGLIGGVVIGGLATGKEGMTATVEAVDIQSGKVVGTASASNTNLSAMDHTDENMSCAVGEKIVEFLASGTN